MIGVGLYFVIPKLTDSGLNKTKYPCECTDSDVSYMHDVLETNLSHEITTADAVLACCKQKRNEGYVITEEDEKILKDFQY